MKLSFEKFEDYMAAAAFAVKEGLTFDGYEQHGFWVIEFTGGY